MSIYVILAFSAIGLIVILVIRHNEYIKQKKMVFSLWESFYTWCGEFDKISKPNIELGERDFHTFLGKYQSIYDSLISARNECRSGIFTEEMESVMDRFSQLQTEVERNNNCCHAIARILSYFPLAIAELKENLADTIYFSSSEKTRFCDKYKPLINDIELVEKWAKEYVDNLEELKKFKSDFWQLENIRCEHNSTYVQKMLTERADFFDNALSYPLDKQQRNAIVHLEDNGLVISSAGSGKTSTIIGRCKYLIEKEGVNPADILLITFTRKAADELLARMGYCDVQCCTFHGLAYKILAYTNNEKPSIADESLKLNVFNSLIRTSLFRDAVIHYVNHMQRFMKFAHQYERSEDYYADRKKYGIQSLYRDKNGDISFTKSEEEFQIATYLTELGVSYTYEEPYPILTTTKDFRQYHPDFTIYWTDEKGSVHRVYLEHYAIDERGYVPRWFGEGTKGGWLEANRKYNEGIRWKRELHSKNRTTLICTHSYDFHKNQIKQTLISQLCSVGVPIREVSSEEMRQMLVARNKQIEKSVFQLISSFANLLKANQKDIEDVIRNLEKNNEGRNAYVVKKIVKPFVLEYESIKSKRGEKDFTDIIVEATQICEEERWMEQYKHILVDEFQDISLDRYRFLQALRTKKPLTKTFCVGDDWQSIYRFAGSDMALFNRFQEFFGCTIESRIETTYRFGEPLIKKSSEFIQKNPIQKKKELHQGVKDISTNLYFKEVAKEDGMLKSVSNIVKTIPAEETILLLGRYTYDARALGYEFSARTAALNEINITIEGRRLQYMTCHSAKGLEADHVILINCNQGVYGFPSLIEDDPLLSYVLSNKDEYEYSEERRLFYVAITRGKIDTYVLFDANNASTFVEELFDVAPIEALPCPMCKEGHLDVVKEGVAKNGNLYKLLRCTNYQAGCQFQKYDFS